MELILKAINSLFKRIEAKFKGIETSLKDAKSEIKEVSKGMEEVRTFYVEFSEDSDNNVTMVNTAQLDDFESAYESNKAIFARVNNEFATSIGAFNQMILPLTAIQKTKTENYESTIVLFGGFQNTETAFVGLSVTVDSKGEISITKESIPLEQGD